MNIFAKIKEIIKEAAKEAVLVAEKTFSSSEGMQKKQAAVAFVTNALPFPSFLKPIIGALLTALIDSSIETAVQSIKIENNKI